LAGGGAEHAKKYVKRVELPTKGMNKEGG